MIKAAGAEDLGGDQLPVLEAAHHQALLDDVGCEPLVAHAHNMPNESVHNRRPLNGRSVRHDILQQLIAVVVGIMHHLLLYCCAET
jgi:hypothetical protein